MSIYINNMVMPDSCYDCPVECEGDMCEITKYRCSWDVRPPHCPLVHVPPHGDLIDRDALMKACGIAIACYNCPNGEHGWCKRSQDAANICEAIDDASTIIPADVPDNNVGNIPAEEGET